MVFWTQFEVLPAFRLWIINAARNDSGMLKIELNIILISGTEIW
jgi:hypothetical protein